MTLCREIEVRRDSENHHSINDYDEWPSPLPCHYFDYVAGTSTGGYGTSSCSHAKLTYCSLIAVMIGRLRMSVSDAIMSYQTLGRKIFTKMMRLGSLQFRVRGPAERGEHSTGAPVTWRSSKYNHRDLQHAIQDVLKKHCRDEDSTREGNDHLQDPLVRDERFCRT